MKVLGRILSFSLALVALFVLQFLVFKNDGNEATSLSVSSAKTTPSWAEELKKETQEPTDPKEKDEAWVVNFKEVDGPDSKVKEIHHPKSFFESGKLYVLLPSNNCEKLIKSVLRDKNTLTIISENKKDSCDGDHKVTTFEAVGPNMSTIDKISIDGRQLTLEDHAKVE